MVYSFRKRMFFLMATDSEETGISYSYRILRTWELHKEVVLQKKLVSLYPLLPLMKERPGETL